MRRWDRNCHGTERSVVPVIINRIVVDVPKTTVVRIATDQTVRGVLEKC